MLLFWSSDAVTRVSSIRKDTENGLYELNTHTRIGPALGEDMYKDGYKNITNIDYSKIVINNMAERCKDMPEMKCKREQGI